MAKIKFKKSVRLKACQQAFNEFVRWRDCVEYLKKHAELNILGCKCISCQRFVPFKYLDAGHYFTVGSAPSLRFNEKNVNAQCTACNVYKADQSKPFYGINLERKYGKGTIGELESEINRNLPSSYELWEKEQEYKRKIKELKNSYNGTC
jgi:hypothetical protein